MPVCFVSARNGAGVAELLDILAKLAPNPDGRQPAAFSQGRRRRRGGIPCRARSGQARARARVQGHHGSVCGQARRVPRAPGHGEARYAAVHRQRPAGRSRSAHLYLLQGKEYVETDALVPGDHRRRREGRRDRVRRGAARLRTTRTTSICGRWSFPSPMHGLAVETKKKGDEQRLFEVLHKLELEDPVLSGGAPSRHQRDRDPRARRAASAHQAGEADAAIQARIRYPAAAHPLSRDHQPQGRGPLPPQEADRRRRPVRRGVSARSSRCRAARATSSSIRSKAA